MDKKQLKRKLKELPVNLGVGGLALVFSLAEGGIVTLDEILKGPGRGLGKSLNRISKLKTFWDYYDELKELKEDSARTILWRLQKRGLVKKKERKYQLTALGIKVVEIFQKKQEAQQKNSWDGKWRMVIFDIPEKKRDDRNWLRWQLIGYDYKLLQKSVFVGKQPLEENFYGEIIIRKLNPYIRLMTMGEIDDEKILNF
ncbi:MAG: hypothetical protein AAB890_03335 [Patescibacteria group bacterium]